MRRGGDLETYKLYYKIHDFMDSSKEVNPLNSHRFFTHQMFFVKNVMIPLFGEEIFINNNKSVNMKDMLEQDHILADYGGKFIPTLTDFSDCIEDSKDDDQMIKDFQSDNSKFFNGFPEIKELMLQPLALTGSIKSLFVTHNSWFVNFILPKLYKHIKIELKNFTISPSYFFNKMRYEKWMQNGQDVPPSYKLIHENKQKNKMSTKTFYDGKRGNSGNKPLYLDPFKPSIPGMPIIPSPDDFPEPPSYTRSPEIID